MLQIKGAYKPTNILSDDNQHIVVFKINHDGKTNTTTLDMSVQKLDPLPSVHHLLQQTASSNSLCWTKVNAANQSSLQTNKYLI